MKLLLDTQILLWAAGEPQKLSRAARKLLEHPDHELLFSAASLWEITIKSNLGRDDFRVELPVTSLHAVSLDGLPPLHKDPFDRILLAQALVEGVALVTHDAQLARYPVAIRKV